MYTIEVKHLCGGTIDQKLKVDQLMKHDCFIFCDVSLQLFP